MRTNTWDGPHCGKRQGQVVPEFTNTFHTLHTKIGIKDSKRHLFIKYRRALHRYIQTEMDFWTSHHSMLFIDMLLKSSKNLGTITNGSSGLQIHNNQSMINTALTNSLLKTIPSHRKRRDTERWRRTLESGVISTISHGTTLMNVDQRNHRWLISNKMSRTLIRNLIQKIMV